ncbi:hypothetical protein D035_4911, partial [Vibrio parahaemolyticus VP250]
SVASELSPTHAAAYMPKWVWLLAGFDSGQVLATQDNCVEVANWPN